MGKTKDVMRIRNSVVTQGWAGTVFGVKVGRHFNRRQVEN